MSLKVKSNGINFNVPTIENLPTERLEEGLVCVVMDENRGGVFVYREANALVNNGCTIFNGWTRQYDGAVNVKWFGARGDGVTDDSVAVQAALDYGSINKRKLFVPVGTYIIGGELTVDDYINLEGEGLTSKIVTQSEFKLTNATPGSVLLYGTNIDYQIKNMRFSTDDNTIQRHLIRIGILGDYASQNSNNSISRIEGCVFTECGGVALRLGGEHYATIEFNIFRKIAQAIAINKNGEINIRDCHFESLVNPGFTAEVGNQDAMIYINSNVTKMENCVFAISEDYRPIVYAYDWGQLYLGKNKMEFPGRTVFTYPAIVLSAVDEPIVTLDSNYITASYIVSGNTESMIKITSGTIRRFIVSNNVFTYSAATDLGVPVIDAVSKPQFITLDNNYREGADNPIIKIPETAPNSETLFGGINGGSVDFVTIRSKPFNIAASQTNAIVPFGGRNYAILFDSSLQQILPVSMSVQASTTIGGTVSFKYQLDSSGSDLCTLPSSNSDTMVDFTKFGLRTQYVYQPDQVAMKALGFRYTSNATVSTSIEYVLEFTYAIISDASSRFNKFMIDIG